MQQNNNTRAGHRIIDFLAMPLTQRRALLEMMSPWVIARARTSGLI